MSNVHYLSTKHDWATPDELYNRLNTIYAFDLDVAADITNAKCKRYFDEVTDGLSQPWAGARVWCNPPYGRQIGKWVMKACQEREQATFIVMLVPARTDTAWWHSAQYTCRAEFLKGRLPFKGAPASAPFPSALLYWGC